MPLFRRRLKRIARFLGVAVIANLVAGFVAGVLARIAMRLIAVAGGTSEFFPALHFTVVGTLNILLTGMLQAIPFAFLPLSLRNVLPGTGWRKLLAYGAVTFVFPGLIALTDSEFHRGAVNQWLGLLLFAPIYFLYGVLIGVVVERIDARRSTTDVVT